MRPQLHRRDFLKSAALATAALAPKAAARDQRPNIIFIMADDMGFSDIGCYGSEIDTPNLDQLAANGLRFTQFYNTGRCCPTRASLLTGLYPHQAGVGHMTSDQGPENPGYRGRLTQRCVTIPEVLRGHGYFTAMTGKWHVGVKQEHWPIQRGFHRFYGSPIGGGFLFKVRKERNIVLDNEVVYTHENNTPTDWYCTDAFTDYAIKFIEESHEKKQPFFLYLAHIAPHWPLQAHEEDIAKYRGKYKNGWDALRAARHKRQIELGIIDEAWPRSPRDPQVPDWESLSQEEKDFQAACMAIYAAMIDRVDQKTGDLIECLKKNGLFDNTLILFFADNGGCAEGGNIAKNTEKNDAPLGSADSFIKYGTAWANASNTPFRRYKHHTHEGGTATPLIAHWPKGIAQPGAITNQPGHVIDLMATCCDLGQAEYPERHNGNAIIPLEGKSLRPILEGKQREPHESIFWEHEGNRAVRQGGWKLVAKKGGPWELYNLEADRTEMNNLAAQHPERAAAMEAAYSDYAKRAYVLKKSRK